MSRKSEEKPDMEFEDQEGRYSSNFLVNFNPTEFIFDFGIVIPGISDLKIKPKIKYHTRLRESPQHAKMILGVLNNQIAQYEKQFGNIGLPKQPSKTPPAVA